MKIAIRVDNLKTGLRVEQLGEVNKLAGWNFGRVVGRTIGQASEEQVEQEFRVSVKQV